MPKYMAWVLLLVSFSFYLKAEVDIEVVTEDWRPYNYEEKDAVKGSSTEIVVKVLEKTGLTYSIDVYPWPRSYELALNKPNVLIYTIIRVPPREGKFKWVRPLGEGGMASLYELKGSEPLNIDRVESAAAFEVASNRNSMSYLWLKSKGFKKIHEVNSGQNVIKMLLAGRVPLAAFDSSVLEHEFKIANADPGLLREVMPLFRTVPYMAFSNLTSDDLVVRLQNTYDELFKAGQIKPVN